MMGIYLFNSADALVLDAEYHSNLNNIVREKNDNQINRFFWEQLNMQHQKTRE